MLFLALKKVQMVKTLPIRFAPPNKKISQADFPISSSYILYVTNILLYIVLLSSVFIIIYKYITIYSQIFNSIQYF